MSTFCRRLLSTIITAAAAAAAAAFQILFNRHFFPRNTSRDREAGSSTGIGKANVDLHSTYTWALRYSTRFQGTLQFYLQTVRFIRKRNEPHLPLPSHPQLQWYQ